MPRTIHFPEESVHRARALPWTRYCHCPYWLRRTSFLYEFFCGKNCKSCRRTSRKAEDRYSRYKEGGTYSPANHHYSTVLKICCSASFYCAPHKTHAENPLDQSVWRDCRGSPEGISGSSLPAHETTIHSFCEYKRKRKGGCRDPPKPDKFFHCDSEPLTDEIYRGFPRRY